MTYVGVAYTEAWLSEFAIETPTFDTRCDHTDQTYIGPRRP